MLSYLYYKLYHATLKGSLNDIAQFAAPIYVAILLSLNLLVVNGFLAKVDIMPFLFSKTRYAVIITILVMGSALLYFRGERVKSILEKYSKETRSERIRGNIIVAVYVAVSFLLIFAVGFFRAGKL